MAATIKLRKTEAPKHDDVREIYNSFGWHFKPTVGGRVALQDVEYDWLAENDRDVTVNLKGKMPNLTLEEAIEVVKKARDVWAEAFYLTEKFVRAVNAHSLGYLDGTIAALDAAELIEKGISGKSDRTKCLRAELLTAR